jgi:peptide/nickel transport system permease protein
MSTEIKKKKRSSNPWVMAMNRLKRNPAAVVGLVILILMIIAALAAPLLAPHDPNKLSLDEVNQAPSTKHLLGTDDKGRDLVSRIIYGSRVSLLVGIYSQSIALIIGGILGALAGYFRGWVDDVIMWLINVFWAFPYLLLILALVVILGPGLFQVFLAVGIASWIGIARIVRGQFIVLREMEFVTAARALGYGPFRIIFRHMLPNTLAPVIVVLTLGFAQAIVAEAALSFLGLGIQPPDPSWGSMIKIGYKYLGSSQGWWNLLFPSMAIMISVLALNLLGDGLRDALDPKMQV